MEIRPAVRADLPAVVGLLADDGLGAQREWVSDPLDAAYERAFDAIDADPNNVLVVVDDAGRIVATLQLTFIPYLTFRGSWRAQIEGVRVAADRRGGGLGRRLITWAVGEADARGCHMIQLTTNIRRSAARRFYESLGFEATHHGMKRDLRGDATDT